MGDRVAVMRKGELQQVAPPQELYDRPANIFVAGFIGSPAMNMLEAQVERGDDGVVLVLGETRLELDEPRGSPRYVGRTVVVGIRPENLEDAALAHDARRAVVCAAASSCAKRSGRRCSSTSRSRRARPSPRTCASSPRTSATTASSSSSPARRSRRRRSSAGSARARPRTPARPIDVEVDLQRAALLRPGHRARDPPRDDGAADLVGLPGTGASSRRSPSAFSSLQSSRGIVSPRSAAFRSHLLRASARRRTRLTTAGWASGNAIAAAGSVVPCRSQTAAIALARAMSVGGASP